MNKKGSIQDILMVGITLFVLSIVILIVYKVSDEVNTEFQGSDLITPRGKTAMNQINNMYPGVIDNSFLFLTIGLSLVALVMAAMVRIHPIFIIFFLIILAVVIFLCAIFSNVYQTMAVEAEFTALADNLIFVSHIMNWLPLIIGVFGSLLAIIMYKSWSMEG